MTFAAIFGGLRQGLGVAAGVVHTATPLLRLVPGAGQYVPEIDTILQRLMAAIATVEVASPTAEGVLKAHVVTDDFQAGIQLTNAVLATRGEVLSYDQAALKKAIDGQVAAYNAMAALKASFAIVKKA